MRNWAQNNVYQYFTFVIGCYPCLYCLAFHQNMVKPLSARGHAPPRTYESICADHQRHIASGVRRKQAQHFYNCITEPIFNIPIEQVNIHFVIFFCIIFHIHAYTHINAYTHIHVYIHTHKTHMHKVCPPGLHITVGIFTKLYGLLEDDCHALDLELALLSYEDAHSSFDTYSQELQKLRLLQAELEQAEEAYAVLQQMTTLCIPGDWGERPVTMDFFVQCEKKKKHRKTSKPYALNINNV